jgi:hypothetical protein
MSGRGRAPSQVMPKQHDFEVMIANRIELARLKTSVLVAGSPSEPNATRRKVLEDCGSAISLADRCLGVLRATEGVMWGTAQHDMNEAWRCMETAVRLVTGEPAVTLVAPLAVPALGTPLPN